MLVKIIETVLIVYFCASNVYSDSAKEPTYKELNLCSGSSDKYYDNVTEKCYTENSKGPCGTYMVWIVDTESMDSQYGICKCIISDGGFWAGDKLNRPIGRAENDGNCYPLFDKANCKEGEWFVLNQNGDENGGVCLPNPCTGLPEPEVNQEIIKRLVSKIDDDSLPAELDSSELNKPFWFYYKGKCYKSFTQGPCETGKTVVFYGTNPMHRCELNSTVLGDIQHSATLSKALDCDTGSTAYGNDCDKFSKQFGFE